MPNTLADLLKDFSKDGGMDAVSGVAGSAIGLATSDSKYKGGQRGQLIGGGVGTGLGALVGLPGVGQQVGSAIGGLIGGASDQNHMIEDFNKVQKKKYSKLNLSANVDPYGSDNTLYMKDGGLPIDPVDSIPHYRGRLMAAMNLADRSSGDTKDFYVN
jgi:hypothetical protein